MRAGRRREGNDRRKTLTDRSKRMVVRAGEAAPEVEARKAAVSVTGTETPIKTRLVSSGTSKRAGAACTQPRPESAAVPAGSYRTADALWEVLRGSAEGWMFSRHSPAA